MEVFLIVALVVAVVLAVFDVFWPLTVAFILGGVAMWWLERADVLTRFARVEFVAAYFAVAFVWVFFKWTRLVERALRKSRAGDRYVTRPAWSDHSYDFAAYFFFWPFDMAAYVLSDLIRDTWKFIARMVGRSFDRYAEWRFEGSSNGR